MHYAYKTEQSYISWILALNADLNPATITCLHKIGNFDLWTGNLLQVYVFNERPNK